MMASVLLLAHLIAMMWNLLQIVELQYRVELTWFGQRELAQNTWREVYMKCLYFGLYTIISGGYEGACIYEDIFIISTLMFTVCIFAYIINKVGMVLEDINQKKKQQLKDIILMNSFMTQKEISQDVQNKVTNYLQWMHKGHQDMHSFNEVNNVFKKLPLSLQDEVNHQIH